MRHPIKWALHVPILALLLAPGCAHQGRHGPPLGPPVDLEPNDSRPVFSVAVGDDQEAAILRQELAVEPLRVEGHTLYFHDTAGVRDKLAEYGYTLVRQSPYAVYQRVVRVARRGEEKDLARFGLTLINREKEAWIVRGSLGSLRALAAAGYELSKVGPSEPRPRQVRIFVSSMADVQRVNELFVDIYSVSREGKEQRGLVVMGGAFDGQIDALTEAGFRVEVLASPTKGDRP